MVYVMISNIDKDYFNNSDCFGAPGELLSNICVREERPLQVKL